MGYMIEISEDKVSGLSEHLEKGLRHIGKAMQCIDELSQESRMGERGGYGRYGNRYDGGGRYGNRYGMRDDEDEWEDYGDDPYMGERRGRSSRTGRYVRR